ncbi:hypothetical protein MMC21_008149 [Puttea exsequens]|nr:hypothetical protein [Puttea exsequens]
MASNPPPAAEGEAPSKNGLKKAQKEKEKAEKKAKKAQVQQGESSQVPIHDTASQLYGGKVSQNAPETGTFLNVLYDIEKEAESSTITFIAQVQSSRKPSAKLAFLVLGQYEHTIQAVAAEGGGQGISRQMVKWCAGISNQSIVRVTATVFKPKDPVISCSISKLEAHILSIYMISEAAQPLPVQPKDCNQPPLRDEEEPEQEEAGKEGKDLANVSLKARLDNRVLSMRPPSQVAIMKINEAVYDLFGEFMKGRGFTYMVSPSFAGAATEGGAGVFEVKYFDTKAYLTQSPQFYKQIAIAGGAGPVYLVGPVFRAENSNTKRHLTEFTGLDFELPIHEHYHEVLTLGEELITFLIRSLQTRPAYTYWTSILRAAGYTEAGNFQLPPAGTAAVRISFAEAKTLLSESGYDIGPDPHADIDTAQEKALGDLILHKHSTHFFSIDKYPRSLRPFYTASSPTDPTLTNSYDFFMRGQEIMSGAQRIHDHGELCANMARLGLDPGGEGFRDYTEAFRYGCVPHGGGGVGLNRVVQFYLGLNNVREATLFPRDPARLAP